MWKNSQAIFIFVPFTQAYLTKIGSERGAGSEGKEVWMMEGSRIIEDLDSEAEEFKCKDFQKQEMEPLPLFFCS